VGGGRKVVEGYFKMANPNPNKQFIAALEAGSMLVPLAQELVKRGLTMKAAQEAAKVIKKAAEYGETPHIHRPMACKIDFIVRHWSSIQIDWSSFSGNKDLAKQLYLVCKQLTGKQRINKCATCHYPGHNKNHCPGWTPI
jgi:hypothetical protein